MRVTDALMDSRPGENFYELLGSNDPMIAGIHRFTSTNPIARRIFLASQYGILEDIFTKLLVWYFRRTSGMAYRELIKLAESHTKADGITIIATHFALAHQMAQIKEKAQRKIGKDIKLVVQVTDDTSQHIWCVSGADLTLVPSQPTRERLKAYARKLRINFNCEVSPYPLSPVLAKKLPADGQPRWKALDKNSKKPINVLVPISGAAVGLGYLSNLMKEMNRISQRFHFWVVAKRSIYTRIFLADVGKLRWVQLITGRSDKEVVDLYEDVYKKNLIHMEVTKPSEQSFKALVPPKLVGGSVLLFVDPVGRQEKDNIDFLRRHDLLMGAHEDWKEETRKYWPRGVRLPEDPIEAARFIESCLDRNLFMRMTKGFEYSPDAMMTGEISEKGTWLFWEKLRILKFI